MRHDDDARAAQRKAKRAEMHKRVNAKTPSWRSEFDFIEQLRQRALDSRRIAQASSSSFITHRSSFIASPSSLRLGIGDDAAVIGHSGLSETVITTDLLVEEIDFRRDTIPPGLLGHKALAVSLSDIAAMGARPRWSLLSIGVPREIWDSRFLDDFYEGFFALAERFGVTLIGGDVSRTPERIVVDSILLGETAHGRAALRSTARPGDHIFVTGVLGGAAAGLRLLERGARLKKSNRRGAERELAVERLLLRQLRPEPRVGWGAVLGAERLASAMIDLSDGLSSDLAHLCRESRAGARIDARRLPINPAVAIVCGRRASEALALALHGGEDFELLFTVHPRDLRRLPRRVDGVPATYIGDVTSDAGRALISDGRHEWSLKTAGFTHFPG
ncbi:MAG: thiamine-monophosphate kinase [Blastocatellia bacterium]|jgi:thiamine-monophosphate kinase|nr:thiamine-monophosphate kinase [Blastocatellia bacterium]